LIDVAKLSKEEIIDPEKRLEANVTMDVDDDVDFTIKVYETRRTPIYLSKFTNKNLLVVAGPYK